jgi:hypothetical protein
MRNWQSNRLGAFVCLLTLLSSSTAEAARLVPVEVKLNGVVILEGSTGDNGEPDADAVWDALKNINLAETGAFKKFHVDPKLKEFQVKSVDLLTKRPLPIVVEIRYGGIVETTELLLQRREPDQAGRVWRISPAEVDRLFIDRLIPRSAAAQLTNPRQERP